MQRGTARSDAYRSGDSTRAAMRRTTFLYQDGVMLCMTMRALEELGILSPSLEGSLSLSDLHPDVNSSGFAYMRAGLRCLAAQGWLADAPALQPESTLVRWSSRGRSAARHRDLLVALGDFLAGFSSSAADAWARPWDLRQAARFAEMVSLARAGWHRGEEMPAQVATHLEGALIVPTMLWLHETGRLSSAGPELPDGGVGLDMGRLLESNGWVNDVGEWTPTGRTALQFAAHLGLVGSYLPLLARLPDLYRGRTVVPLPSVSAGGEWHVQRELNVRASAAAHSRYFTDAMGVFAELFDRQPVRDQPAFIADVGCGDASWLIGLHRMVEGSTLRGEHLSEHPLRMVAVDSNAAAREQARAALDAAGVPALVVEGDIGDPDRLCRSLAEHGLAMNDGLHIRAFVDHDRAHVGTDPVLDVPAWSSGAYVDPAGCALDPRSVEGDLIAHLRRWAPHVRRHGLVVLEAHCVAPHVARDHLGALHSVAFDAYHAYSHQYPIDHGAFMRCCRLAGLQPASHREQRYPSTRPFVAVSINRLLALGPGHLLPALNGGGARQDTWTPDPSTLLEDGEALHRLLFSDGDIRYPRAWCSAATGFVVAGALQAIELRLADASPGEVIRVLDYGAGTGLAAIELLKACRDCNLDTRLTQREVTLELHLVDLPSSWFAQGFELLSKCAWTRFHSLTRGGAFRPLIEATEGRTMDVVIANMVFHLLPPPVLERAFASIADVIAPGGRLLWSSPDLGPPGRYSVLFHDANRALRQRWLGMLAGAADHDLSPATLTAVQHARSTQDEGPDSHMGCRSDRRILPHANAAEDVHTALRKLFDGEIERPTYEMRDDEVIEALLVPSNQAEYLPEIEGRDLREDVIRELMLGRVLPEMRMQPSATALGLNVQWTLGNFAKSRR